MKNKNITIFGAGYVGLANALLFSKLHNVFLYDIDMEKVEKLKKKQSPIRETLIQERLVEPNTLVVSANIDDIPTNTDIFFIATPTNYSDEINGFDTSSVENSISHIDNRFNKPIIVIRSTVPIGFTEDMNKKYTNSKIFFMPEFLREGHSMNDLESPSRIIIGKSNLSNDDSIANEIINICVVCTSKKDVKTLVTNASEAESIKLFSNTYLAMRVAFFNELDTYAELHNLNSVDIIKGVSLDPRIGMYYNNPSFGYGGYCLPKDTKQLKAIFSDTPNDIISAVVDSNQTRKIHIVDSIMKRLEGIENPVVGVYRLIMKEGSDNFRESSIIDIIGMLKDNGVKVIIYEPNLTDSVHHDCKNFASLDEFIAESNLIITNRTSEELIKLEQKIFTRDILTLK